MNLQSAINLGLSAVPAVMLLAGGFAVWRSALSRQTIQLYKDNQEALEKRLVTVERDHADNLVKIADLQREVAIVKTLPLDSIMETLKTILSTQNTILETQNKILGSIEPKTTIINNNPQATK